jgi:hypothetical protein
MKKLLLVLGAAAMVACMNDRDHANSGATMNEPAGAQTTNSMNMNSQNMNASQPRDVNQQPYPGQSSLNPQRGSYSTGDSSQRSTSGSTTTSGGVSSGGTQNP